MASELMKTKKQSFLRSLEFLLREDSMEFKIKTPVTSYLSRLQAFMDFMVPRVASPWVYIFQQVILFQDDEYLQSVQLVHFFALGLLDTW